MQTRAYILGLASLAADQGGYATPREAEETRDLLDEAISARYQADPQAYAVAVERGRVTMIARAWESAYRKARSDGHGERAARARADKEVPEHRSVAAVGSVPSA